MIAARLVALYARESDRSAVAVWADELVRLLDRPALPASAATPAVEAWLEQLAVYLEELLRRCDAAVGLAPLDADRDLAELTRTCEQLVGTGTDSTQLAGMDGDGSDRSAVSVPTGNGQSVVLLIASVFRREVVARKLRAAQYDVELAADPEAVRSRLERTPRVAAVLCDAAEPSRHLQRLARLGVPLTGRSSPPVILIATTGATVARRRARTLGAAGVWRAPFCLTELTVLLP
jgi:CheY-like chemotaxis protein